MSVLVMGLCAAALLLAHITAQAACTWVTKGGMKWGLGARDGMLDRGAIGARMDRALRNFLETLPLFIIAMILMRETGVANGLTSLGALLYLAGRAAFLPLYALGVPVLRSVVWGVATLGPILMLAGVLTGIDG